MRVFVTGGAGFIGSRVVRILRARGDGVVAAVRDPGRAHELGALGCDLVASDLGDRAALAALMQGVDAVIHVAGSYRIGIAAAERSAMWEANVGATERVLDAAISAPGSRAGTTRPSIGPTSWRRPGSSAGRRS